MADTDRTPGDLKKKLTTITNDLQDAIKTIDKYSEEQQIAERNRNELEDSKTEILTLKWRLSDTEAICKNLQIEKDILLEKEEQLTRDMRAVLKEQEKIEISIKQRDLRIAELEDTIEHSTLKTIYDKSGNENVEPEDKTTKERPMQQNNQTQNKSGVAELSDENRPTKLAERYTELFDNLWTDAFEQFELHYENEKDIIEALLKILEDVSNFCKGVAQRQMEKLETVLTFSDDRTDGSVPGNVTKQLKDCRRATSSLSKDRVYELYQTHLRQERGQLKYALTISSFVKECIEICWLMENQDPPVVFGPTVERGEELNTDVFKAYLRNGPYVDFVVWPAMFLHKGGPVLAKGVAQGYGHKIHRRKETLADEITTQVSRMTQITLDDQDTGYVYGQDRSPYGRTPINEVYNSPTQKYQDAGIPSSEYTKYSHKDSHQRTRSAEEPKRTFAKATGKGSTNTFSKSSYEREPSVEEMKTFFRYYDRCDYMAARNVLGDKVYERCWRNAYKRYKYY